MMGRTVSLGFVLQEIESNMEGLPSKKDGELTEADHVLSDGLTMGEDG